MYWQGGTPPRAAAREHQAYPPPLPLSVVRVGWGYVAAYGGGVESRRGSRGGGGSAGAVKRAAVGRGGGGGSRTIAGHGGEGAYIHVHVAAR